MACFFWWCLQNKPSRGNKLLTHSTAQISNHFGTPSKAAAAWQLAGANSSLD